MRIPSIFAKKSQSGLGASKAVIVIIGHRSCPACRRGIEEALALKADVPEFKFRFVDISKDSDKTYMELVNKYKAVPIYILPDGTASVGVKTKKELKDSL